MRALIALLCSTLAVQSEVSFCGPSSAGSGDGSDFDNRMELPNGSGLLRGNEYVIIEGSYGSRAFSKAESGTTPIKIRRANAAQDSGVAGWSTTLVDSPSDFTFLDFSSDYWEIDGITGQWASDLPGYEAYGIRVLRTATADGFKAMRIGQSGFGVNHVTLSHVEATFTQGATWYKGMDIVHGYGTFWTFSYVWFHDAGRVCLLPNGVDDITVEFSVMERSGRAQVEGGFNPSEHSETVHLTSGSDRAILRHSFFRDWRSTGGIIVAQGTAKIYGCVFEDTGFYSVPDEANDSNGVVGGNSKGVDLELRAYNNTFVNLRYGASVGNGGSWAVRDIRNNVFYNTKRVGGDTSLIIGGTHDYNWFFDVGPTPPSEANSQTGSGDPFVAIGSSNFRLAAGTDAGDNTVGSEYEVDPDGNTRGSDGTWDRGAFEFFSGSDETEPDLGTITVVTNATSFVVSFTANEAVTNVLNWGTTTGYGNSIIDGTFNAVNEITVEGLSASTEYHFQIVAGDSSGNETTTSDARVDTLALDETSPMITLDEPDDEEAISGVFGMQATATDNVEMLKVEFFVDGTEVGEDTDTADSTFAINWNSRTVENGEYDVWARAEDTSANQAFSATNTVTVNNVDTGGLVAHWQFSSGSLTVDSVGTNTLTLVGDATSGTGKTGDGLALDGDNDRATAVNSPDFDYDGDQITVGCWINLNSTGTWQQPVVKIQSTGSNQSAWHIYIEHEDSSQAFAHFQVRNTSEAIPFATGSLTVPYGEWTHIVGVYDGLNLIIYVNGTPSDPTPLTGDIKRYDQPLFLGSHGNGSEDVNGTLDDIRIYNTALTGPEVLGWYQETEVIVRTGVASPTLLSIGIGL